MPSSKQEVQSLLTEHFRYTPLTLIDDIINTVNEIVYRAVDAVENGLSNTPATLLGFTPDALASPNTSTLSLSDLSPDQQDAVSAIAKAEIETGVHQLETLLESSVDSNFDRLEIYLLRNILTVPDGLERWIRLRHYDGLQLGASPLQAVSGPRGRSLQSQEDLVRTRRKLHESQKLYADLREEQKRNAALLKQLRATLSPSVNVFEQHQTVNNMSFLQMPASADGAQNQLVTIQMQAAVSQLPQLKKLVGYLREMQKKSFSTPRSSTEDAERSQYLERGVELAIGGTRTSSNMKGSKVSKDDVHGIENIARSFS